MSANIRDTQTDEAVASVNDATGGLVDKAHDIVNKGTVALRSQYQAVRDHGVAGVKDDVVGYAKREPLMALLVAGGIGALAALLIKRRL